MVGWKVREYYEVMVVLVAVFELLRLHLNTSLAV